jgi:uncharacterized SAM-dependent methyltransferase
MWKKQEFAESVNTIRADFDVESCRHMSTYGTYQLQIMHLRDDAKVKNSLRNVGLLPGFDAWQQIGR